MKELGTFLFFYKRHFKTAFLLAGLAAIVLHLRLHIRVLNPFFDDWLWNGDWSIHYLGSVFFRFDPWGWPAGAVKTFIHPFGTTIVSTDSIPIFAVLLKAFRGILPEVFQYFGLWFFLNIWLMGLVVFLLVFKKSASRLLSLVAAVFFMTAPVMMTRMGHPSQVAQWIFPSLFGLYWLWSRRHFLSFPFYPLAFLLCLTLGFHPYLFFTTLVVVFSFVFAWLLFSPNKLQQLPRLTLQSFILLGLGLFLYYFFGYGSISTPQDGGFGYYSSDLLSFFHPHDFPVLLPNIPRGEGQYEGYAYLGLGFLVLAAFTLHRSRHVLKLKAWKPFLPLLLSVLALWLFALATPITLAGKPLFHLEDFYSLLEPLPGIFRSSGRFVWAPFYLFYFGVFLYLAKTWVPNKLLQSVVVAAVALQLIDINRIVAQPAPPPQATAMFKKELKLDLSAYANRKHLVVLDAKNDQACEQQSFHYEGWHMHSVFMAAAESSFSVNLGSAARFPRGPRQELCHKRLREIQEGKAFPLSVFLLPNYAVSAFPWLEGAESPLKCDLYDEYRLCVSK